MTNECDSEVRDPTATSRRESDFIARGSIVRKIWADTELVLLIFAGSAADGIALFERLEGKLREHGGNLRRAAVEMAKDWRTDRVLRRLEAMLAVADKERSLIITGAGDVLEPEHGILAIGSGGPYAQAAARALVDNSSLPPKDIVAKALNIAGEICIYTNQQITIETLE